MRTARQARFRWTAGIAAALGAAFLIAPSGGPGFAAPTIFIGVLNPLTGADAEEARLETQGALMAIEEANARGGIFGYHLEAVVLDDGTATAGQYDPAQAASNARRLAANPGVVASLGPENSGEGKAIAPILSEADLATVSPSTADPDITSARFASTYRPRGKPIYFRTCTTNDYQGSGMANFFAERLRVRSVYVLDDSGTYGVNLADTFQAQAPKKGIKVLGRDQLNPKEADYTTALTKIKALAPASLFYGGTALAGIKVAKQSYEILPQAVKGAGGGMYKGDVLQAAGFPAIAGWYVSAVAPHLLDTPQAKGWVGRYVKRWGAQPSDYTLTAYDAGLVVLDAIRRVALTGRPVDRHNVRDAIQTTRLQTLQGLIQFDANGDLLTKTVSVFQIVHDSAFPPNDVLHQYKYLGVAPQT
jgi:branched-chain amino acid transport system substrate-binding protein